MAIKLLPREMQFSFQSPEKVTLGQVTQAKFSNEESTVFSAIHSKRPAFTMFYTELTCGSGCTAGVLTKTDTDNVEFDVVDLHCTSAIGLQYYVEYLA